MTAIEYWGTYKDNFLARWYKCFTLKNEIDVAILKSFDLASLPELNGENQTYKKYKIKVRKNNLQKIDVLILMGNFSVSKTLPFIESLGALKVIHYENKKFLNQVDLMKNDYTKYALEHGLEVQTLIEHINLMREKIIESWKVHLKDAQSEK